MKVKMIKDLPISRAKIIRTGRILSVRYLPDGKLISINPQYQVIDGEFSGRIIPKEYCIEIPKEKTYTEKEYNDMESYYMGLLDEERKRVNELQNNYNNFLRIFEKELKQNAVAKQVSIMLDDWLNKNYEGDKQNDRHNFSLELTKFIQEKLV